MDKEVKGITVEFEDGTTKRLTRGCVVDLDRRDDQEMSVDMLMASSMDIVQMAYGLLVAVNKIGMKSVLLGYLNGTFKEEEEEA